MPDRGRINEALENMERLRGKLADLYASERPGDADARAILTQEIQSTEALLRQELEAIPRTPDHGLAQMIGLGPDATRSLDEMERVVEVKPYDEVITAERLYAIADLYYAAMHEAMGCFKAVLKLQELFKAGRVRLSSGEGAVLLYQYDRKQVLQYSSLERMQAYKRVFGYTNIQPPVGSRANMAFHNLFTQFNRQVVQFFEDRRVSDVVRSGGTSDSFGSIAAVRRAGLDLRSNLKQASYGHVNVLTVEVYQLLERTFEILEAEDVKNLFGADSGWDVLEEIMRQFMGVRVHASERNRLAVAGRNVLRWLAESHILGKNRAAFEAALDGVGEDAEEWVTTALSLGIVKKSPIPSRRASAKVIPLRRQSG